MLARPLLIAVARFGHRMMEARPTPWIGLWERINISVFLLWIVVLAAMLWRTRTAKEQARRT